MSELKLIIVDPRFQVCHAMREYFEELPDVEVVSGYFQDLPEFDCMVSAANSFGLMGGGVDLAIVQYFGDSLEDRVQKRIIEEFLGGQPVGTSMIVETGHEKHPYLAHTPTMRVPMDIAHTDNVCLAMSAMLRAVYHHNQSAAPKIQTIACPGLGTGARNVPYREAARQMSLAYKYFLNPHKALNWTLADDRQSKIRFGGDMGFHFLTD